ncbi:hypothetical protein GTP46_01000 [Duganella sp. FT135W]|uniref:SH3 domain-containing protein n=1 Tax=Duganella flavida TaxID=2692175 RepID=A0A6L8K181_9BURK|nr:hypothetical protein [Duganella flavida]MYM21226.1 hypothetical protein [Duganella flavida]
MGILKKPALLAAALFALALPAAHATEQITAIKGKQVELFDAPDDGKPGRKVEASGLPWTIKEEKNSFFKVAVGGKDVWVDAMQVNVARNAQSECPPKALATSKTADIVAGVPGVSASQCK